MKLLEIKKSKPIATATRPAEDMDDLFSKDFFAPEPAANKSAATRQEQAGKISKAVASADMTNAPSIDSTKLSDLIKNHKPSGHASANPEPPKTPGTDIATVKKDVMGAGSQSPDWLQVSQLPGYMQHGIRAMGDVVFGTFTHTPLSDINILANLQGKGPSEHLELNAVAHHARKTAEHTQDLDMEFGEIIPGYKPDAKLYTCEEDTYLVVRDDMGDYIYHWPTSDSKTSTKKLHSDSESTKRLN